MGQLGSFVAWAAESTKTGDFAVIYLEEAHPTDGWLYPAVKHFIKQHKSAGERSKAATILEEELASLAETHQTQAIPVFADSMSNAASLAFGALPERLVILLDGQVKFIGGKGPEKYSIDEAKAALLALTS